MRKYLTWIIMIMVTILLWWCNSTNFSNNEDPTVVFRTSIQQETKRYQLELNKQNRDYTGFKMILSISTDELKSKERLYSIKEQIQKLKELELTHISNTVNVYKKYKQGLQFTLTEAMDESLSIPKDAIKTINEQIDSIQNIINLMNRHYLNEEGFLNQNIIIADILIQNHDSLKFIWWLPIIENPPAQKEFYVAYQLYMRYNEEYNKSREEIRNLIKDSI